MISFSPVWVKLAGVSPSVSAFYRVFLGAVVLWIVILVTRARFFTSRVAALIAVGLGVLFTFDLTAWHTAIEYIGPGMATILGNFQVFLLSAFGVLILGERLTFRFVLAVLVAMVGLYLMFGLDWSELSGNHKLGVGLGLVTALMYGSILVGLKLSQSRPDAMHPMAAFAWLSLTTSVTLAIGIPAIDGSFAIPSVETGIYLTAYAVGSHVIGWVLISDGIPHIKVTRAGLLLLLQPSLSFLWDVLLFGRRTTGIELAGAAMALIAIYLGSTGVRREQELEL